MASKRTRNALAGRSQPDAVTDLSTPWTLSKDARDDEDGLPLEVTFGMRALTPSTAAFAAAIALALALPACAQGQTLSREKVGEEVADVLEALARRSLTAEEIATATDEFIPLFGDSECTTACVEAIEWNARQIAPVLDQPGTPADVRVRHLYISATYFNPQQNGSLIQRLSAEADPIMVVERSPQRLMTRADVIASMNLYHFARESGPPTAREFPESEIEAAAKSLNEMYGTAMYIMPRQLPSAAVYWTGLRQNWKRFSGEERQRLRGYFAAKRTKPLTGSLYAQLLGLSAAEAEQFYVDEMGQALLDVADMGFQVQLEAIKTRWYGMLWTPY